MYSSFKKNPLSVYFDRATLYFDRVATAPLEIAALSVTWSTGTRNREAAAAAA